MLGFGHKSVSPDGLGKRACVTSIIGLMLWLGFNTAAAQSTLSEYEVRGTVEFKMVFSTNESTADFTVSVRGGMWSIILRRHDVNASDYEQITFDGQSLFFLDCFESQVSAEKAKGTKVAANVANAIVSRGEIPHRGFSPEIGPIWLAYASATFFSRPAIQSMEPPIPFDGIGRRYSDDSAKKLRVEYGLLQGELKIPSGIVFFDDGIDPLGKPMPSPYNKGFTNSIYAVRNMTNLDGIALPACATLSLLSPRKNGQNPDDLQTVGVYTIYLNSFRRSVSDFSATPRLPGPTGVTDLRMKELPNIFYWTTNKWPSVSEIETNSEYKEKAKLRSLVPPHQMPKKRVVSFVLILITVVPVALYLLLVNKQKSNKI